MKGILLAVVLGLAAPAMAQGPGAGRRANAPERPRDELMKMIDAYIVANLQESVGLTDEQFVKVLPLLKKLHSDRRDHAERRHQMLREMRGLLASGRATEPRIAELMRSVRALENDAPAAARKDVEALDAVLSAVQQAKLRILEVEVEQKIRGLMNRARKGGAGRRTLPVEPSPE